jgi:hypothetical protein
MISHLKKVGNIKGVWRSLLMWNLCVLIINPGIFVLIAVRVKHQIAVIKTVWNQWNGTGGPKKVNFAIAQVC